MSGSDDKTVRIWDLARDTCLAVYGTRSHVILATQVRPWGLFACCADRDGFTTLTARNLPSLTPLTTPARLWLHEGDRNGPCWDRHITAPCQWCGERFVVDDVVLDTIVSMTSHLAHDESPCMELPPDAWDEPRLRSECPLCHQPLRFNPFVVDNRE